MKIQNLILEGNNLPAQNYIKLPLDTGNIIVKCDSDLKDQDYLSKIKESLKEQNATITMNTNIIMFCHGVRPEISPKAHNWKTEDSGHHFTLINNQYIKTQDIIFNIQQNFSEAKNFLLTQCYTGDDVHKNIKNLAPETVLISYTSQYSPNQVYAYKPTDLHTNHNVTTYFSSRGIDKNHDNWIAKFLVDDHINVQGVHQFQISKKFHDDQYITLKNALAINTPGSVFPNIIGKKLIPDDWNKLTHFTDQEKKALSPYVLFLDNKEDVINFLFDLLPQFDTYNPYYDKLLLLLESDFLTFENLFCQNQNILSWLPRAPKFANLAINLFKAFLAHHAEKPKFITDNLVENFTLFKDQNPTVLNLALKHLVANNAQEHFSDNTSQARTFSSVLSTSVKKSFTSEIKENIELLIKLGADLNYRCDWNLLSDASSNEMVDFLLSSGAEINYKNSWGYTALHLCNNPDLIKHLLAQGADANLQNNQGYTPLESQLSISVSLNKELIKILIDHSAQDNSLTTSQALHLCCDPEIIEYLIAKGMCLDHKNAAGFTALEYKKSLAEKELKLNQNAINKLLELTIMWDNENDHYIAEEAVQANKVYQLFSSHENHHIALQLPAILGDDSENIL